jgi:hypothetical protein
MWVGLLSNERSWQLSVARCRLHESQLESNIVKDHSVRLLRVRTHLFVPDFQRANGLPHGVVSGSIEQQRPEGLRLSRKSSCLRWQSREHGSSQKVR